ncbi:MAG: nitrilotriacetate monooxygenase [Betaproteobacteria bacterium RIFCSPLOWO2_02_FULL_62_17]|nr:MAG: nitrilotriacetate monooxygenase [Betaproteobacteria bacterium RIFCSPLOWO2_02_FULL_62_17]
MSDAKRMMKLGVFFNPTGHHVASWRHPRSQADAGINVQHYVELAQTAERGCFDMIFLADNVAVREAPMAALSRSAQYIANFEPLTLLSALSMVTKKIGLVATASTSFNEPFNIARKFASLDHLSGGRAGWNIVTTASRAAARNFGRDEVMEHHQRYERAKEFTRVVMGLWDSWDDDAFLRDKGSGLFFRPEGLHSLDHKGEWFSVKGPLNIPRSPQGYPVLVQAGSSDDGRSFAAEFAEAIFTGHVNLESAQEYYADVKARARGFGRNVDQVVVMPGLSPVVGRTEKEAQEKQDTLQSLVDPVVAREILSTLLGGVDLSPYPLDGPLPDLPPVVSDSQSTRANWVNLARKENLSIGQLAMRATHGRGKSAAVGTPAQIADHMEKWFTQGGADGFNIQPPVQPGFLDDFVEMVIPVLQERGLVRGEYQGDTLREHLGLPRPENRHKLAAARTSAAAVV